jgi:hypothetical protein
MNVINNVTSNRRPMQRASVASDIANDVVPSSPILVTLMKEALSSSETSVHTIATRRNIEYAILHSHRRENLKSYMIRGMLEDMCFKVRVMLSRLWKCMFSVRTRCSSVSSYGRFGVTCFTLMPDVVRTGRGHETGVVTK